MTLRPHARRAQRGSVTFLAFFVALLLGGLSLAVLQEGVASKGTLTRVEADARALELAEAGLSRAERELNALVDATGDGVGCVSGTLGGGTYEVVATQDTTLTDRWTLVASGVHGRSTRRVEVLVRRVESRLFSYGLLSDDDLVFDGLNVTDAYDSRVGSYASQAVNVDASGAYAEIGGSVASNSGVIDLHGSTVTIRGDAIPGPLHEVEESGDPIVLGDTTPRRYERELPPPPYADFLAASLVNDNVTGWTTSAGASVTYNPTTNALTVRNGTLTLTGGTYFFSSVTLRSHATLAVAGASSVYVTGSLDMTGGTLSNPGAPGDLLVYAHPYDLPAGSSPATTTVKVNGGSEAAWAFYGPACDVTIGGGGALFGAVVAKTIKINGDTAFHYDRALGDLAGYGDLMIERIAWRELSSPRR